MTTIPNYVIRGGIEGRERLRILSRVMEPSTKALLDRLGLRDGSICADVGCGGGDVSLELARRVAPTGHVIAFDIDQAKLDLARAEAKTSGFVSCISTVSTASTTKPDVLLQRIRRIDAGRAPGGQPCGDERDRGQQAHCRNVQARLRR